MGYPEYAFIAFFFGVPGLCGAWLASGRGKNPLFWGLGSALFPFLLVVLWFQKPDHEVKGRFRLCRGCGRTYPWKKESCVYCGFSGSAGGES